MPKNDEQAYGWFDAFIGKKPPVVQAYNKKKYDKTYRQRHKERENEEARIRMAKKYADPEWRAKKIEYERTRKFNLTLEQRQAKLFKQKERVLNMTEEEYKAFCANHAQKSREYRARQKAKQKAAKKELNN